LKINRIMPFCNLFMERPSYNKTGSSLFPTSQSCKFPQAVYQIQC